VSGELARESGTHREASAAPPGVSPSVLEERDRYREALLRIANAQSGVWGQLAHEALHPRAAA
jgi:hypothetical protein